MTARTRAELIGDLLDLTAMLVYIEKQDMADYSAFMATRPAWRAAREIAESVSE